MESKLLELSKKKSAFMWTQVYTSAIEMESGKDAQGDWIIPDQSEINEESTHDDTDSLGINIKHAFTIMGARKVTIAGKDGKKAEQKTLVTIRNPWGEETGYKGPFGPQDERWSRISEKDKQGLNLSSDYGNTKEQDQNGQFVVDMETFYQRFKGVTAMYGQDFGEPRRFMMLDDKMSEKKTGRKGGFTSSHKFNIRSSSKQKLYITAHTWMRQQYPRGDKCKDTTKHMISIDSDTKHKMYDDDADLVEQERQFIKEWKWGAQTIVVNIDPSKKNK